MGGCLSTHHHHHHHHHPHLPHSKGCSQGCLSISSSSNKSKSTRRRFRRKPLHPPAKSSNHPPNSNMIVDTSQRAPSLPGSREEDWFDSAGKFESDCEEEFLSFQNDAPSSLSFNGTSISRVTSMKNPNHEKCNENVSCLGPMDEQKEKGGSLTGNATTNSVTEVVKNEQSPSPAQPQTRKKSVKWVDEQSNSTELPTKRSVQRPIAGSKVPLCPKEEKVFGSWSHIEPCTFKVRAENYLRDRKKDFAPNCVAYYPFGVDVFLSQKKVDHIARFVELPQTKSNGKLPSLLVVNVQIPLYSPSIFQSANDGEGMSVVLYFRLSDSYSKEMGPHFLENLRRIIDDEVEQVKGYSMAPVRERLKILGRVANADDLQLSRPEKKLMHAYNGKPILSRPQHEFYSGGDYFEIDLDMHRFSYVSRKGFDTFQNRLKHCILDVGLTIQGNKEEELPEQVLCCIRLNGIDHTRYKPLVVDQESL